MMVGHETRTVYHKYESVPEVTHYLLVTPQSQYSKTVFVTSDKGIAYRLKKHGSVNGIKLEDGYDVDVVKLKIKTPKHVL